MKVNRLWWLGLLLFGMLLVIGWSLKRTAELKDIDWAETYQVERKMPYGMYLLFRQLKNSFSEVVLSDGIPQKDDFGDIYLYINRYFQPDSTAVQRLIQYIKNGGQALIVAEYVGTQLMDTLLEGGKQGLRFYFDIQTDTSIYVGKNIPIKYWEEGQIVSRGFASFRPYEGLNVLDQNQNGNLVLVKFKLGKGQVYIHTVPVVFANIQIMQEQVFDYVEWVFQFLKTGVLIWDIKNKSGGLAGDESKIEEKKIVGNQPLRFILRQRSLATAFYLSVITALLYLFFGSRVSRKF